MQQRHYKTILYFISTVILATLAIQVYWNYKNYEAGKAQLIRDVQISVDKGISTYYENLASQNTLGFFGLDNKMDDFLMSEQFKSIAKKGDSAKFDIKSIILEGANADESDDDLLFIKGSSSKYIDSILHGHSLKTDTTYAQEINKPSKKNGAKTSYKVYGGDRKAVDSISDRIRRNLSFKKTDAVVTSDSLSPKFPERLKALSELTTSVVFSFNMDTIDVPLLDSMIKEELFRKNLNNAGYELLYSDKNTDSLSLRKKFDVQITSDSQLLPKESTLIVGFNNVAVIVLKRNLIGILLSILLVLATIACLLYLLRVIQEQKQLAEIKNDFISNITHEFKTPIATIGVAMESIQFFNDANDVEKTKKYVDMSSQQVAKLNTMVEKLLETATLDSEVLMLNKQETNIAELLTHISQSHQETLNGKALSLDLTNEDIQISVDLFHLENALDNIIDNAIKYGGNHITVKLHKSTSGVHIDITDGGNHLTKTQTHQIFEKFYRVPKGNTHDVKGFGIGLYYTKTIIEKHAGTITVQTQPTIFKITLPYV